MSVYGLIKNTSDAVSNYLISKLGEKMYQTGRYRTMRFYSK